MILAPVAAAPSAFGQASAQRHAPSVYVATPAGKGMPTAPAGYPRGYQSPTSMFPGGSPQSALPTPYGGVPATPKSAGAGPVSTPYGMIPGQSASGQIGPALGPGASPMTPAVSPEGLLPLPDGSGGAYSPGGEAIGGAAGGAGSAAGVGAGDGGVGGGAAGGTAEGAGMADGAGGPGTGADAAGSAAAAAAGMDAYNAALSGYGGPGGATSAEANFPPNMIGDLAPMARYAQALQGPPSVGPPGLPATRAASVFAPSIRTLKISENQSPRPQDRVFYNFNYFSNVGQAQNIYDRSPIRNMQIFRHVLGFEKTFDEGRGSFGLRMPIETLTADSPVARIQTPTSTAVGNLNLFAKYILKENVETGSLASVGLAITPPTGPSRFADASYVFPMNNTSFQPFLGYILNYGDFYIQGFSSFLFTSSSRDVTLMSNDLGIGYYLYRSQDPDAFLTAFVPNFEVHVNSPFTHRDWKNRFDPAATPDIVNLTYGLNFLFGRNALLSTALVTPVTGPRPFDAELAVYLNVFYGRTRAGRVPIIPPVF